MVIDTVTRWGSTYLMAKRLLELKGAVIDLSLTEVRFTQQDWEKLERLVEALRVPYDATLALQSEKLTPGQCFLNWRQVVFKLGRIGGMLANGVVEALNQKEQQLLDCKAFLGAIWIDCR